MKSCNECPILSILTWTRIFFRRKCNIRVLFACNQLQRLCHADNAHISIPHNPGSKNRKKRSEIKNPRFQICFIRVLLGFCGD